MALVSVALSNCSNTSRLKLQFQHEANNRRFEVLRERGEELYSLTEKWLLGLAGYYLNLSGVMQGKLTYNQALDLQIAQGNSGTIEFSRIELLIDVYFPSTRAAYDALIAGRTNLNKIAAAHKRAYQQGDIDGSQFLNPFVETQKAIEKAGDSLKQEVIDAVRSI